jgi:N-acetylglucosamine PTS system EIIB component
MATRPSRSSPGPHGVLKAGNDIQVVVGPEADTIASDIGDLT